MGRTGIDQSRVFTIDDARSALVSLVREDGTEEMVVTLSTLEQSEARKDGSGVRLGRAWLCNLKARTFVFGFDNDLGRSSMALSEEPWSEAARTARDRIASPTRKDREEPWSGAGRPARIGLQVHGGKTAKSHGAGAG